MKPKEQVPAAAMSLGELGAKSTNIISGKGTAECSQIHWWRLRQ